MEIALAWATKKRHIAADGNVLCSPAKSTGYSVKNGQYNSLGLSGVPTYPKTVDDVPYTHCDGVIEFKPLAEQPTVISTRSICRKCLERYGRLLVREGRV